MEPLKRILFIATLALIPPKISLVEAAKLSCVQSLTSVFRNSNLKTAERILKEYSPFDKKGFSLTLITETDHSAVLSACTETGEQFILKVNSLSEAFNDYYGLRVLKKLDPPPLPSVKIIHSVFLTEKSAKSFELYSKVLQKNPYTEGRPLAEILVDPNVPTTRKTKLYKHYSDWLKDVARRLETQGFEVNLERPSENFYPKHKNLMIGEPDFLKSQPSLLKADKSWRSEFKTKSEAEKASLSFDQLLRGQFKALVSDPDEDLLILIKSDNVMVNDADELTLFDPF
jgi:hypothetical protein